MVINDKVKRALITSDFIYPKWQELKTFSMISGVIKIPTISTKKNAKPPNDGTILWCELLKLGCSISLFFKITALINGIMNHVTKKENKNIDM